MSPFRSIADIRRDYGELALNEESILSCPIAQFKAWFEEVLVNEQHDPTAMVLSTVDAQGQPDSRVVLLKALEAGDFVFYTNYQSTKALQIAHNPSVALNFYWPHMARQVRIRGQVNKVSAEESDNYFSSRPFKSQCSALVSPQSQVIAGRGNLEDAFNALVAQHAQQSVSRPQHWGGYKVVPHAFEFWQGRDNRLHDRIQYSREGATWLLQRLAP